MHRGRSKSELLNDVPAPTEREPNLTPETRTSLLLHIRDPQNHEQWAEFVELYAPVIESMARKRGLQQADAEDVLQRVMLAVSQALAKRPHDTARAKFRTWLKRVAENAILNAITRRKPDQGGGGSLHAQLLADHEASDADSLLFRQERQERVFQMAAERIRTEFAAETWTAFWSTAVEGQSPETVAESLGKNVGSIYAARSRVVRRLRDVVNQIEI